MPIKIADLKKHWTLYRYTPEETRQLPHQGEGTVYEWCRDVMSIDYVAEDDEGSMTGTLDDDGNIILPEERAVQTLENMYSISIRFTNTPATLASLVVTAHAGHLLDTLNDERLTEGGRALLRRLGTTEGGMFGSYDDAVRLLTTREHYNAWKLYNEAKIHYDKTGEQNFHLDGTLLLFPCERDVRKRIREDQQRASKP